MTIVWVNPVQQPNMMHGAACRVVNVAQKVLAVGGRLGDVGRQLGWLVSWSGLTGCVW